MGMRGTTDLEPGNEVKLVQTNGQEISYAEIIDVWRGPLGDVPAVLLEMMHDPLQRTFAGFHMLLAMSRAEEDEQTGMGLPISVIVYRPKASTLIRPTNSQIRRLGLS
jgi:hypothetical protein